MSRKRTPTTRMYITGSLHDCEVNKPSIRKAHPDAAITPLRNPAIELQRRCGCCEKDICIEVSNYAKLYNRMFSISQPSPKVAPVLAELYKKEHKCEEEVVHQIPDHPFFPTILRADPNLVSIQSCVNSPKHQECRNPRTKSPADSPTSPTLKQLRPSNDPLQSAQIFSRC